MKGKRSGRRKRTRPPAQSAAKVPRPATRPAPVRVPTAEAPAQYTYLTPSRDEHVAPVGSAYGLVAGHGAFTLVAACLIAAFCPPRFFHLAVASAIVTVLVLGVLSYVSLTSRRRSARTRVRVRDGRLVVERQTTLRGSWASRFACRVTDLRTLRPSRTPTPEDATHGEDSRWDVEGLLHASAAERRFVLGVELGFDEVNALVRDLRSACGLETPTEDIDAEEEQERDAAIERANRGGYRGHLER